ncbi:MAG: hypothetical protein O3B01_14295 [Planctomycetota bacterium]|nr:hypothetical protein [Planctomycetota bacterium]MDA1139741.1 hypothetical protein [Planctomycetota bacterium]
MTNERLLKYVVFFLVCMIVSIVYSGTKRTSVKNVLKESVIMMGYICGGMGGIGVIVYIICELK